MHSTAHQHHHLAEYSFVVVECKCSFWHVHFFFCLPIYLFNKTNQSWFARYTQLGLWVKDDACYRHTSTTDRASSIRTRGFVCRHRRYSLQPIRERAATIILSCGTGNLAVLTCHVVSIIIRWNQSEHSWWYLSSIAEQLLRMLSHLWINPLHV